MVKLEELCWAPMNARETPRSASPPVRSYRAGEQGGRDRNQGEPRRGGEGPYTTDMITGALMVPESRVMAGLLLQRPDAQGWKDAILERNVLKVRRGVALRVARLLRARLETMGPDLLNMVRDGHGTVVTLAVLSAAVKHSRLLGDFLALVVAEQHRQFGHSLSYKMWDDYLDGCRERDRDMPQWSDATSKRLRSSVLQTLAQAGYIENTRSLRLRTIHIPNQVLSYLKTHREDYILKCIQVGL